MDLLLRVVVTVSNDEIDKREKRWKQVPVRKKRSRKVH
jgi:hypothetical protein